jgi:hypothetical protein
VVRQAASQRILENVSRHGLELLVIAQNPLEVPILPKVNAARGFRDPAGSLPHDFDAREQRGAIVQASEHDVDVLRHVAVRRYFKGVFGGRTRKLRVDKTDQYPVFEVRRRR